MALDLLIRNVTLVSPARQRVVNIFISDGQFSAILDPGPLPFAPAAETIDGTGLVALPGLIDGHVHFREPGLTHEETWLTGTRAAVFGGVTTVLDMPNTIPPTDSVERAREKLALAEPSAYCDFGIFGLIGESADRLAELARSGLVVGLKAFMGPTTGGLAAPDDDRLRGALLTARAAGLRVACHAEDRAIISERQARLQGAGRTDALAHLESRPVEAEVAAIDHFARLLSETGTAGHVAHVSSAAGLDAVREWQRREVDVTCEVTPHHALLGREVYTEFGAVSRVNPPIRGQPDAGTLLDGLGHDRVGVLASDHAPHLAADKAHASIWEVPSGFAGTETMLPLMLTAVSEGMMHIEELACVSSQAPAMAWGLWPRKGQIAVGADADLTLVDLERAGEIRAANLHGMNNISPFEGRATKGAVVTTIVRGRVVVRDGQLAGEPGWGQPVRTNSRSSSTA